MTLTESQCNKKIGLHKKESFKNGRRAGIYLTLQKIVPIPLDLMDKDLLRASASRLKVPQYYNLRDFQLKQAIQDKGYSRIGFKPSRDNKRTELILT